MSPTDPRRSKDPIRPPIPSDHADLASLPQIDLGSEGAVDLGDLNLADDEVPLAALPEPPSGQSLTSWTEVIRRQRAASLAAEVAGPVRVDAPSDRDLLNRLTTGNQPGGAARRPGDTSEIPQADLPMFKAPTGNSESDIDLGRLGFGGGTGESEIKFDVLYPPSDAGGAMPFPEMPPPSGIDFRAATPVPPPPEDDIPFATALDPGASGVNLGAEGGTPSEGGRSSILDVLLKDAGQAPAGSGDLLDYGTDPVRSNKPTVPTAERPALPTRPAIDLSGANSPDDEAGRELVDSNADLGSEDAIDLYAGPAASPSITDSGTLEISEEAMAESQRRAEIQESSSVDLSSRPSFHGTEFDEALEAPSKVGTQSDSDIDLNLPPVDDEGNSSLVHGRAALDANSAAIAAEFEARRKVRDSGDESDVKPVRSRRREVVPARDDAPVRSGGYLIHGGIIGLLLGAGGVLAAYFGGALPNRQPETKAVVTDNSAELTRLKQDADAARSDAARQVAEAKKAVEDEIRQLTDARTVSDAQVKKLTSDAQKAQTDLMAALKTAADAKTAEQAATAKFAAATKVADDAKTDLTVAVAAKKAADDMLAGLTKAFKDAGIDAAKPNDGIKKLVDAKAVAETKATDADAKLAEMAKKETDLLKLVEVAKKSAEEATRVSEASAATMKAIGDRLAKAKFVGDKADAAALLKGIDDAVKAGTTDATATLRDELAKVRAQEAKAKADLAVAKEKEAAANTLASAAKAESEKSAAATKTEVERSAAEVARLRAETDRLTRDLDAVKELADLIKNPASGAAGPYAKPEPARLAEQFFGDGVRAFHGGRHTEAESAFRKAIQFRPDDARYHYLLGLTLWARKEVPGAEAEFEKGRDLELASRPSSRTVSAALERIQGQARQTVDAYRP